MNLPNKLTLLRVIMVPFFVFFMLWDGAGTYGKYIAAFIFIAASITDWFDGYLARRDHLVTDFGKFMDPMADKLLVCSALICLVDRHRIAAWIVIVLIGREFVISGFRLIASEKGVVIAASYWGKFKTAFQMVMVVLLILNFGGPFYWIGQVLIWISLLLAVISLVDYLKKNWKVMEGGM